MFLGIDIGTSSVKAVLMDQDGRVADSASAPLPISRPHAGWSEQDPEDWWRATGAAVLKLDAGKRGRVEGIGLSGQMHGATLLDAKDRVLRPAILWNDGRSEAECSELERREPKSRAITGNIATPGFTAPKLVWVQAHEPDTFKSIATILLPKDYVRLRMTGEKATDLSDAAGTLWVDVGARAWSAAMLSATGLRESQMPSLHEGNSITGALRADIAVAWGVPRAPVAAGAGDNAAGAVGVGAINDGETFLSLGTSGVIFAATSAFRPNPARAAHAFCHALPDRWHLMSVMLSAAACLDWAAELTGQNDAATLIAKAQARGRLDGEEIFLPYLSGERTPHNDPRARGVLFGANRDTDAAALGQAVLEGVAFGLADGLDALTETGAKVDTLSVIGGGAQSAWWGRILAAALQRPLVYRDAAYVGPAFGAARLARLAVTRESIDTVCAAPTVNHVIEPRAEDIDALHNKSTTFARLYENLRPVFRGEPHG